MRSTNKLIPVGNFEIDINTYGRMYHATLKPLLKSIVGNDVNSVGEYLLAYRLLEKKINQTKMRYTTAGIRKTRCCAPVVWRPRFGSVPGFDRSDAFKKYSYKYINARCSDYAWCPFCYVRTQVYKYAYRALHLNHAENEPCYLWMGKTRYKLGAAKTQKEAYELAKTHTRRWANKLASNKPSGVTRTLWVLPRAADGFWVQESVIIASRESDGWVPYPDDYLLDHFDDFLEPCTSRRKVWSAVGKALSYPPELLFTDDSKMSDWFACHNLKTRYTRSSSFGDFKRDKIKRVDKNWAKPTMRINRKILDESINVLNLDVRIVNALEDDSTEPVIKTVRDLLCSSPEELKKLPNVGNKTITTILDALAKAGIHKDNYKFPEKTAKERKEQDVRRRIIGL